MSQIAFAQSGQTRMVTTKSHDALNRLTSIVSTNTGGVPITEHIYAHNSANQRVAVTNVDGSRWVYQYDALGQVTSGKKYWADSTPVAGQQFEYAFDDIGNRKSAARPSALDARRSTYLANPLNQYISRTVPGMMDILGAANSNATVTVNLQPTARKGDYYHRPLALNNRAGAVWQSVTNLAVLKDGTNPDILSSNVGSIFLPQTPEVYAYDADGNLTRDGHWTLTWNGENRLVALETVPAAVSTGVPKEKLEFTYDHQGRRVQKKVYAWDTDHWSLTSDSRFLYDGWNLIAILDPQSSILRSFTWGLDLSGSLQGAGGVGGLLLTRNAELGTQNFVCFDGNGNVMALVDAADGTESARYEYGPFGEVIRATGPMAKANPFRFSTKYQDDETGWNYYGYRFYDSSGGRWASRDPIEERGGKNVYAFVGNNPLARFDALGHLNQTMTSPSNGTLTINVVGEKIDNAWDYQRNLSSFITWTPPTGGMWSASRCWCKPCERAEWRQQIKWGWLGMWHDDNAEALMAVIPWDCNAVMGHAIAPSGSLEPANRDQATSEDHPGISSSLGSWAFYFSSYRVRLRTKIQCVVGRDAGKVYFSVKWGGDYDYDSTPVPSPISISTSDWGLP